MVEGKATGCRYVEGRGWQVIVEGQESQRFYVDPLAALSDASRVLEGRIRGRVGRVRRPRSVEAVAVNEAG